MVSINTVFIGGHLGADPEERRTSSGKLVCNFRIATNRWDQQKDGDVTEWHSIVCWEKQAELCVKYLRKGSAVLVEGRLQERHWDGADGKRNYRTEVIAARVSFIGSPRGSAPVGSEQPTAEGPTPTVGPEPSRGERRARRERGVYGDEAIPF